MKIIIIGAGEVGSHLAGLISRENHDIVVIDHDTEKIGKIAETLDVLAIQGKGTSPRILREAGIEKADMLIAVTAVDEVNILACMIAKQHNVKSKIARVRNREFSETEGILSPADLGIDLIIHPELEATREIVRLIKFPQAIELIPYCQGEVIIAGIKINEDAPVDGRSLIEIAKAVTDVTYRVIAITRNGSTIIPRGHDRIEADDTVYVSCQPESLPDVFAMTGHDERETRHVMIHGATPVAMMVAEELSEDKRVLVKVIESDKQLGKIAAERLEQAMIVVGEASDLDLITQEGIIDQDVFIALTDDNETNIVTSLLARHLQVPKTITLIGKSDYIPIVKTIGLDITINSNILTSNAIFKFIRHGDIVSLRHMIGTEAEAIEFKVTATSQVVGKTIKDIKFPTGSIVMAVEHQEGTEIPVGTTKVFVGDKVVMFCLPEAVKSVIKLFE